MKAVAVRSNHDEEEEELDLGLSIGGSVSRMNVPLSRTSTPSASSLTLVTDGDEDRPDKRGRSFGSMEEEADERNRPLKREKKQRQEECVGSECNLMKNVDLNLSDDQVDCPNQRDPVVQMSYPYSSLQYVPFLNGYAFPCVVPYWAAAAGAAVGHGGEKTLHHPVACRSFRPFQTNRNDTDGGLSNGKTGSCGSSSSPVCSSSVISDNYHSSSSHEGGGSSYTRSNSSNSSSDQHQMICPNPNDPMNDRPSSNHVKPKPCSDNRTQCQEKFVQSHVSKTTTTTTVKKEPINSSNKDEVMVPSSKSVFNSLKNMKMENGKPPKPQIQSRSIPNLQQMPCVSTTGVGPNGKTITGFLYRYSNLEVSILCVCHGESFSPAEFVKHAGGAEVSHPLRHITVLPTYGIPSATR